MSLDYPDRKHWLKVRHTGSNQQFRRKHPPVVLWVSKPIHSHRMEDGSVMNFPGVGQTYVRRKHGNLLRTD